MAKTVFITGGSLSATNMNDINGIDASTGMIMDGADTDGHAPKVDINNHTQGSLLFLSKYVEIMTDDIEFSFDDGVSYTVTREMEAVRSGTITGFRFTSDANMSGTMTIQANLKCRRVGGASWPFNIFGPTDTTSTVSPMSSSPNDNRLGTANYLGTTSDIEIVSTLEGPFQNNELVTLFGKGSFIFNPRYDNVNS